MFGTICYIENTKHKFYVTLEQKEAESVLGRGLFYYHALAVTLLQTNNEWGFTKDLASFTFTFAYKACHILFIKLKEIEIRKYVHIYEQKIGTRSHC